MAILFCTDFCGWGESTLKLLLKIHQYFCNRRIYERSACFLTKFKSPSSNRTFILRKIVENLCDMAYKIQQNRPFERSLFTLRDPVPLSRALLRYSKSNKNATEIYIHLLKDFGHMLTYLTISTSGNNSSICVMIM